MSNPIDLIKNGDFVEVTNNYSKENEWFLALTNWYGKILLINNSLPNAFIDGKLLYSAINKIVRYKDEKFNFQQGLTGNFNEGNVDVIYDKNNDVLELTVKDIEKKFGQRVKIVSEPVEKIVKGGMYKGFKVPNIPDKKELKEMIEQVKLNNSYICLFARYGGCSLGGKDKNCKQCIYSMGRANQGNLRLEFLEKLYKQEYGE